MPAEKQGEERQSAGSKNPYLKMTAKESMRDGATGTGSWSILKNLHMSILDGGVSILKQGLSSLSGAFQALDSSKILPPSPSAVSNGAQLEAPTHKLDSGEPRRSGASAAGEIGAAGSENAAYGVDWIDNLLEELDSTELPAGVPQASESTAVQAEATGAGRPASADDRDVKPVSTQEKPPATQQKKGPRFLGI